MKKDTIKEEVKKSYAYIAKNRNSSGCCNDTACCNKNAADYANVDGYQKEADLALGCGLPTEIANIKEGDTVIDLGSGAGNDVFIARRIVGENGKVIGIDMTPEMINRAQQNNQKLGYKNVEFVLGEIEDMYRLSDQSADVIISNCVMNLVQDKEKAFTEVFRLLKTGGHFSISDIVYVGALPVGVFESAEMYASCVAGASEKSKYLDIIKKVGFQNIEIKNERLINLPDNLLLKHISADELSNFKQSGSAIYSITIYADKLVKVNEIDYIKPGTPEANNFPAVGNRYEVDYGGDFLVQFQFHSIRSMSVFGMKGKFKGFTETVEIRVTPIRPQVFMVAWQEENQTTVIHIEDFEKGIIYANITLPGNSLLRLQGHFSQVN